MKNYYIYTIKESFLLRACIFLLLLEGFDIGFSEFTSLFLAILLVFGCNGTE